MKKPAKKKAAKKKRAVKKKPVKLLPKSKRKGWDICGGI